MQDEPGLQLEASGHEVKPHWGLAPPDALAFMSLALTHSFAEQIGIHFAFTKFGLHEKLRVDCWLGYVRYLALTRSHGNKQVSSPLTINMFLQYIILNSAETLGLSES